MQREALREPRERQLEREGAFLVGSLSAVLGTGTLLLAVPDWLPVLLRSLNQERMLLAAPHEIGVDPGVALMGLTFFLISAVSFHVDARLEAARETLEQELGRELTATDRLGLLGPQNAASSRPHGPNLDRLGHRLPSPTRYPSSALDLVDILQN